MNRLKPIKVFQYVTVMLLLIVGSSSLKAQKLNAQVSKNKVAVGEPFQLIYSINTNINNFNPPNLAGFDVAGPSQSTNMQIINGSMSQSISLSYQLAARKEGKLLIGPASVVVNGKKIESNSISIEVVKGNPNNNNNSRGGQDEYTSGNISSDDLFVKTTISKNSCYLGEQLVLSQKIYSRSGNIRGIQNAKLPAYNGFWSQEENKGNKQAAWEVENLDGINYNVVVFNTTYLFPQRTGKLTIDPIDIDLVVRQQSNRRSNDIFEQFFGGGYQDVVVKLKSKSVSVDVLALPEAGKPGNFSGAVGNFNFKAELDKSTVKANEAINLKITLHGNGNVKLIDAPKIVFPESFETYDPKLNENIVSQGGVSGTKNYDYLIIPRQSGEFVVKDLDFTYFDPSKKQYITIPSPEFKITVQPGAEGSNNAQVYTSKQKIEQKENDIRYIKTGDLQLQPVSDEFFSSWKHFTLLLLPILMFAGFLLFRKQHQIANSNITLVKERQAAKIARKQLTLAHKLMVENKKDEFYTEVFVALNRFTSDKLNLPVAELSKENIEKNLSNKKVKAETIQKLLDTFHQCELVKYAPGAISGDLKAVYNNTIELISTIENELKA